MQNHFEFSVTHRSQCKGISDLSAQTTETLVDIQFISHLFPRMKVAHFWADNIQIHMLYSCLHIHVTVVIPALDIPKMNENNPQSLFI